MAELENERIERRTDAKWFEKINEALIEAASGREGCASTAGRKDQQHRVGHLPPAHDRQKKGIPDDHMVACETDAGVSDTTLSSPASAYCS